MNTVGVLLLVSTLVLYGIVRGLRNRKRFKPLADAAILRLRSEGLVTAGEFIFPLDDLLEVRAEPGQLRYVRRDNDDILLDHDVAGPIEVAVLKALGAPIVSIFSHNGSHVIWNRSKLTLKSS
jgi:hypothetical protein